MAVVGEHHPAFEEYCECIFELQEDETAVGPRTPAEQLVADIWCAVLDSGNGNLLARAKSSTSPKSLTKMSTADSGV